MKSCPPTLAIFQFRIILVDIGAESQPGSAAAKKSSIVFSVLSLIKPIPPHRSVPCEQQREDPATRPPPKKNPRSVTGFLQVRNRMSADRRCVMAEALRAIKSEYRQYERTSVGRNHEINSNLQSGETRAAARHDHRCFCHTRDGDCLDNESGL